MTRPVKLLIIDDSPEDRAIILDALRAGPERWVTEEVACAEAFTRSLEAARYDLAIVERRLAWSDGLKVGHLLRERYPDCPLMMISRDERLEAAVEAVRAGFDNFVPKTAGRLKTLRKTADALIEDGRIRKRDAWTETRLQELLGRLNVGVYRATTRGIMLYANAAFCSIFGIGSWREAPGWTLRSLLADPSDDMRLNRELKRTGFIRGVELKLRTQGSKEKWISLTQSLRPGGETLGVIEGMVEDITERKVEALAGRRREEELRQHQRMETVGRLAGGVAHDFNNLLTAINGYSELLLGHFPDQHPMRENAEEIRKAGNRAAVLTRQLLAFSSRLLLQPRLTDLNALIGGMERSVREALGESVQYRWFPSQELGPVFADPVQLENVLMGLVINARDAMHVGGTLTIRTTILKVRETGWHEDAATLANDRLKPGSYALLILEDTGIGMSKEILARIFEPFFTTKPPGSGPWGRTGTGLGLSTAYGILKQSGGAIHADSEPGKGTRMRLYLPLAMPKNVGAVAV